MAMPRVDEVINGHLRYSLPIRVYGSTQLLQPVRVQFMSNERVLWEKDQEELLAGFRHAVESLLYYVWPGTILLK